MLELNAGLNAYKFATIWRFPKSFYHSLIRFANDLYTLYNRLNTRRLARLRKKKNMTNMWISQTINDDLFS